MINVLKDDGSSKLRSLLFKTIITKAKQKRKEKKEKETKILNKVYIAEKIIKNCYAAAKSTSLGVSSLALSLSLALLQCHPPHFYTSPLLPLYHAAPYPSALTTAVVVDLVSELLF